MGCREREKHQVAILSFAKNRQGVHSVAAIHFAMFYRSIIDSFLGFPKIAKLAYSLECYNRAGS